MHHLGPPHIQMELLVDGGLLRFCVLETLKPLELKNSPLMLLLVDGVSISPAMGYTLGSTNQPARNSL